VERVLNTYEDVIGDTAVEAIYNPLANSLHREVSLRSWRLAARNMTAIPES
jgi:predicted dehydrogenase